MLRKNKLPELISGAGDWPSLRSAIASGADSVYFGVKNLNMRAEAANFDVLELKKIIELLHKNNKKGYLTLNAIIYNQELDKLKRILKEAKKAKVDAVILWDMAAFSYARELGLKIHLSTQASVSNFLALKKYYSLGVKRIVLARECSLEEIKKIAAKVKQAKINCQLETFIHGAMCVSVSGRCFLSQYSFSRSANRGQCLQPCRREYFISDVQEGKSYRLGRDYILSPKDLCSIDFIDKLIEAGISAFKIEGRVRSPEYISVVTSVYRKAIDAYFSGTLTKKLKIAFKDELKTVYNRGFSSGFYFSQPDKEISRKLENKYEKIYLGEVLKFYKKINVAEIKVVNLGLKKGDDLLCMGKATPASFFKAEEIQINHKFVDKVEKGNLCGVKLPFTVNRKDKLFLWQKKFFV